MLEKIIVINCNVILCRSAHIGETAIVVFQGSDDRFWKVFEANFVGGVGIFLEYEVEFESFPYRCDLLSVSPILNHLTSLLSPGGRGRVVFPQRVSQQL